MKAAARGERSRRQADYHHLKALLAPAPIRVTAWVGVDPNKTNAMSIIADRYPFGNPRSALGGGDVVVEVKDVVRVVDVLDRGQARALGLDVGAPHTRRALVAERV